MLTHLFAHLLPTDRPACVSKYSMKEYTTKIYLYINMYSIILNFNKQMNTIKAKIDAYLLNLALCFIKQLQIQN